MSRFLSLLLCAWSAAACAPEPTDGWNGELEDEEACFHRELPGPTGNPAVLGTTSFASADDRGPCAPSAGPDLRYLWTPDESRPYRISTAGSSFDTVLYVLEGCAGTVLECNDDGSNRHSRVTVDARAYQDYVIVVDGYRRTDKGPFQLFIE